MPWISSVRTMNSDAGFWCAAISREYTSIKRLLIYSFPPAAFLGILIEFINLYQNVSHQACTASILTAFLGILIEFMNLYQNVSHQAHTASILISI